MIKKPGRVSIHLVHRQNMQVLFMLASGKMVNPKDRAHILFLMVIDTLANFGMVRNMGMVRMPGDLTQNFSVIPT